MSIVPIITFKAGRCEIDTSTRPHKVKALPEPGYIFLYSEDDLTNFCWRPRNVPIDEAPINLVMIPGDGRFEPYDAAATGHDSAKTNGRIFVLKFTSSSQRYLFWLQSKPQAANGDPSWLSPRDRKIGELVDRLLQGETPDIGQELAQVQNSSDDSGSGSGGGDGGSGGARRDGGDDDDETMEDVEGQGDPNNSHGGGAAGGPGAGATGGDVRSEGEGAREGGADGARAASSSTPDAATVVRNLLASLTNEPNLANVTGAAVDEDGQLYVTPRLYPMLNDLLDTATTVPVVRAASEAYIDKLLDYLPPIVLVLSQKNAAMDDDDLEDDDLGEPTADAVAAAKASMTLATKKALVEKVLRSPQFAQSLASLSTALREGGLPGVAEALGIPVRNGGYIRGGSMAMGGGEAVQAFVEGVKAAVEAKRKQ